MRILHTADLHLGQIIYRHYERADEHRHFFSQLKNIIADCHPDALVVSGDIFDVQQPSASAWKYFTATFVELRRLFPDMHIVIVAGNHDSASRLQSHSEVWELSNVNLVGVQPPLDYDSVPDWQEQYLIRLPEGYIIALPFLTGNRTDTATALQEFVARENIKGLPVVMTGHMAVSGSDLQGHDLDIGTLNAIELERLGSGFDYLALGHIHKPQTLGTRIDNEAEFTMATTEHPSPVARYSGSPIHVSGDEAYPHSVSVVDIDRRGGNVSIQRIRINQLRHFHILGNDGNGAFKSEKEALSTLDKFIRQNDGCYIRLKVSSTADLSPEFNSKVYTLIENRGKDIRYNPKILWMSQMDAGETDLMPEQTVFEVSELQQMGNPLEFVRRTIDRYPGLDCIDLEDAFFQIEQEINRMEDEKGESISRKNTHS